MINKQAKQQAQSKTKKAAVAAAKATTNTRLVANVANSIPSQNPVFL